MTEPDFQTAHRIETYRSLVQLGTFGLKFVQLVNGGAAIALLAYLGDVTASGHTAPDLTCPMMLFLAGLVLGGVAAVTAYVMQLRLYGETVGTAAEGSHGPLLWLSILLLYIEAAGESLDIHRVVAEYHSQIMDFYKWFETRQSEIHGALPAIYSRMLQFGRADSNTSLASALAARLDRLEQQPDLTFSKLYDALSPALTILDQQQLELYRHDARAFVLEAVRIIETRFGEISGLQERLIQLLGRPRR